MKFKVNFGYDRRGRERNRYYASAQAASDAVSNHFRRTGIVLGITADVTKSPRKRLTRDGAAR